MEFSKDTKLETEDIYAIGQCLIEWLMSRKDQLITFEEQSSVIRMPKILKQLNENLENKGHGLIKLPLGFNLEKWSADLLEIQLLPEFNEEEE